MWPPSSFPVTRVWDDAGTTQPHFAKGQSLVCSFMKQLKRPAPQCLALCGLAGISGGTTHALWLRGVLSFLLGYAPGVLSDTPP